MSDKIRVICPLSACSSYKKRDQFLALLSNIATVTRDCEQSTLSYAWFISTGDNTEVPNHYVRGFEVYEDEAALVEIHRLSEPYKKMRSSVVPDKILEKPTDLRFLCPAGAGFRARCDESLSTSLCSSGAAERSLIVIIEIAPEDDMTLDVFGEVQQLAGHVTKTELETTSFWVLRYLPKYSDNGIVIFSKFKSSAAYRVHQGSMVVQEAMTNIRKNTRTIRTTRWLDIGIGFISR